MIKAIIGTNDYAKNMRLQDVVSEFVATNGDFAYQKFDGIDIDYKMLEGAVLSMPFLSHSKLIVVRDLSQNKELLEHIDALLDLDMSNTELVLIETKIDKRSVFYKTLKAKKIVEEYSELDDSALGEWLMQEAKKATMQMSRSDAQFMIDRLGNNQYALFNELQKLIIHGEINKKSITLMTMPSPKSTIFELLDAAFSGNTKLVARIYADQRAQRVEPEAILPLVAWQLHIFAVLSSSGDRSVEEIASVSGINSYVIRKNLSIAKRIGEYRIKLAVERATVLDKTFKSKQIDREEALLELLLSL